MSARYGTIGFTSNVAAVQQRYGSRSFYARHTARAAQVGGDELGSHEQEFLSERDGFYLASVSESGWPYVQFRGGPPGFLRVVDARTIGWADFRGNLQYISAGNLAGESRVAIIAMDYPGRRRLKLFGHARVALSEEDPELIAQLTQPDYDAVVERAVVVSIDAFDWNCPQHITPRYTIDELGRIPGRPSRPSVSPR
jgi:uncharacterized protein